MVRRLKRMDVLMVALSRSSISISASGSTPHQASAAGFDAKRGIWATGNAEQGAPQSAVKEDVYSPAGA